MGYYINYKVTNTDLFNSVDDVEFDLKCYERHFEGDVCIEINGDWKTGIGITLQLFLKDIHMMTNNKFEITEPMLRTFCIMLIIMAIIFL